MITKSPYDRDKTFSYRASFGSIIGIVLIVLFLKILQCSKEKDCYVCTIKTTWIYGTHTVTAIKDEPFCDVSKQFIGDFEHFNTYSDTSSKMIQTCKCR
jgi:hypothetical protein